MWVEAEKAALHKIASICLHLESMADSGKSRRRVTAANANKKQKKKKGTSGGELDKMVNRSL